MISNILYKLSSFADYSLLSYNKDDIIAVLNAFDDMTFVPSVIQEILPTGETRQRMQFLPQGGLILITILSERIDIQITSNDKTGFPNEKVSEVTDTLIHYMNIVLSVFAKRISDPYRIAWFTSYVYFEIDELEKAAFRNRFLHELDFYKSNRLEDTIARYAAYRIEKVNGEEEKINVVTTINNYTAGIGTDKEVKGFQIDYDINTWQGNKKSRFTKESIEAFSSKAWNIQTKLNEEVLP